MNLVATDMHNLQAINIILIFTFFTTYCCQRHVINSNICLWAVTPPCFNNNLKPRKNDSIVLLSRLDDRRTTSCSNKTGRNKLLQACCHQLVTCRRCQTSWNNLLRVCWPHQPCYKMILLQDDTNLFQTCLLQGDTTCSRFVNNWEQAVRTYLVDKLWHFYACIRWANSHPKHICDIHIYLQIFPSISVTSSNVQCWDI
jgi:hypothetical protein